MAKRPATEGKTKATAKRAAREALAATSTTGAPSPAQPAAQPAPPVPLAPAATGAPPPRSDEDTIKRIDELIKNARTTWFALLGALVFAAITLAGVKDVAFFVSDIETELPLVGFSVPIVSFFWAGGLLTAALYIYFHLYLEQLWQELGDAPARIGADPKADPPDPGRPLADCIHPWLVSDTALRVRDWMRASPVEEPGSAQDKFIDDVLYALTATAGYAEVLLIRLFRRMFGALAVVDLPTNEPRASRRRGMGWISNLVSVSLVWMFGLAVITWFWWRSMPAHSPFLTFWLGAVLAMTIWVFFKSIDGSLSLLSGKPRPEKWKPFFLVVFVAIIGLTTVRTWVDPWAGQPRENKFTYGCALNQTLSTPRECWRRLALRIDFLRPASANLREVVFTKKPHDWQGMDIAEAEFRLRWCKENTPREEKDCGKSLRPRNNTFADAREERTFQEAWKLRWSALLATFTKPDLRNRDLRGANLAFAFMEGANLSGASLEGANLSAANLEGASLQGAGLEGAELAGARLNSGYLKHAIFKGANLRGTSLQGANLLSANFDRANLSNANLDGAILDEASFDRANLAGANLVGASLHGTSLEGASLLFTKLVGANLFAANLDKANLGQARLDNASLSSVSFGSANLAGANLAGARLFGTNARKLDFGAIASFKGVSIPSASIRFADLSRIEMAEILGIDESFGDGSIILPAGINRPPRWCATTLDDPEFFGRWRGYLDPEGDPARDDFFEGHPPIPPGPC